MYAIDFALFQQLDNHRKFILNPARHDNVGYFGGTVPVGIAQITHEILKCIETFDVIDTLIFHPVIPAGEKLDFELIGTDGHPYK